MKKIVNRFLLCAISFGLVFTNVASVVASASNGLAFKSEGTKPLAVTVSYYSDICSRGVAWTTMQATEGVLEVVAAVSEEEVDWSKAQKISASMKVEDSA